MSRKKKVRSTVIDTIDLETLQDINLIMYDGSVNKLNSDYYMKIRADKKASIIKLLNECDDFYFNFSVSEMLGSEIELVGEKIDVETDEEYSANIKKENARRKAYEEKRKSINLKKIEYFERKEYERLKKKYGGTK